MPLQNRVTPYGEIVVDPSRGALMGNRGILHKDGRELGTARWRHPNWVTCVLCFGTRRRQLMAPDSYTELFFLDEATALSAGHRPCAQCRNKDYKRFLAAWAKGHGLDQPPTAKELDAKLHAERVSPKRQKLTRRAPAASLPQGTMITLEGQPFLIWGAGMKSWSFLGYGDTHSLPRDSVEVLTPWGTVLALAAGFVPMVDESAGHRGDELGSSPPRDWGDDEFEGNQGHPPGRL
ncbi:MULTISPECIES: hypothetical protein [unclassified Devosia]|uniref:hypothetical protein n=1 Tax=unclassified Devosia TaxID=196773 RepID=UPI001AEDFD03|nr:MULTISPECIES: hypothetical protein [unclassified Devosia]